MQIKFSIPQPNDFHSHLRADERTEVAVKHAATQFQYIIAMPNLKDPVTTTAKAAAYLELLKKQRPSKCNLQFLIPLYFSLELNEAEAKKISQTDYIPAVKFYPDGVTTNSQSGLANLLDCTEQLELMADYGIILLVHGESPNPDLDIFDREADFFQNTLLPLLKKYPTLKVVYEHVSSATVADYFLTGEAPENLAATITPHHLILTRNDLLDHGLEPHHFCYPVCKSPADRAKLRKLATSGHPRIFAGTDSAPHRQKDKYKSHAHAGIYSQDFAVSHYTDVFHAELDLNNIESQALFANFMSNNGAIFYNLAKSKATVTIAEQEKQIPAEYKLADGELLIPFRAGEKANWQLVND